jgi:hypothetical protein
MANKNFILFIKIRVLKNTSRCHPELVMFDPSLHAPKGYVEEGQEVINRVHALASSA